MTAETCYFCNCACDVIILQGICGAEYRCNSCGNYILDRIVMGDFGSLHADEKHMVAGYLYETKDQRDYDVALRGLLEGEVTAILGCVR